MQPHAVYNKHKELLQSCYWELRKIQPIVLALPIGLLFFLAHNTALGKSPVLQQEECRVLISAMTNAKIVPR